MQFSASFPFWTGKVASRLHHAGLGKYGHFVAAFFSNAVGQSSQEDGISDCSVHHTEGEEFKASWRKLDFYRYDHSEH
ncbi:hypothetical protein Bca4012_060501 [Brassica carinata]